MNQLNKAGYSKEEEYFFKKNQELLEKRREELKGHRERLAKLKAKEDHWMKCPKCGGNMQEEELSLILIERCLDCDGVYFDKGEVETLLESHEPHNFLKTFNKIFGQ